MVDVLRTTFRAALALPLLLVVACAADEDVGGSNADLTAQGSVLDNKVAVFTDRLEFDADARKQLETAGILGKITSGTEPVYLVGKPQADALEKDGSIKATARNPSGYLRRAVSFTSGAGGRLIVKTEPADLADAAKEVQTILDEKAPIKAQTLKAQDLLDRVLNLGDTDNTWSGPIGPAGGYVPVDESGKELWKPELRSGQDAVLKLAKGKLTIAPTIDIRLVTDNFKPKSVAASVTADIQGDLLFQADASAAFNYNPGGDLYPARKFGTSVKGLPLSIELEVKWKCVIGSTAQGTFTFGATANGGLRGTANWDGKMSGSLKEAKPFTFARVGPTLDSGGHAGGTCTVTTNITTQIFDAAGPKITADLYVNVDADATNAQVSGQGHAALKAGVKASFSGTLQPFGLKLLDIKVDDYTNEKPLYDQDFSVGK